MKLVLQQAAQSVFLFTYLQKVQAALIAGGGVEEEAQVRVSLDDGNWMDLGDQGWVTVIAEAPTHTALQPLNKDSECGISNETVVVQLTIFVNEYQGKEYGGRWSIEGSGREVLLYGFQFPQSGLPQEAYPRWEFYYKPENVQQVTAYFAELTNQLLVHGKFSCPQDSEFLRIELI